MPRSLPQPRFSLDAGLSPVRKSVSLGLAHDVLEVLAKVPCGLAHGEAERVEHGLDPGAVERGNRLVGERGGVVEQARAPAGLGLRVAPGRPQPLDHGLAVGGEGGRLAPLLGDRVDAVGEVGTIAVGALPGLAERDLRSAAAGGRAEPFRALAAVPLEDEQPLPRGGRLDVEVEIAAEPVQLCGERSVDVLLGGDALRFHAGSPGPCPTRSPTAFVDSGGRL